jgi:hypothetical protein
LASLSFSKEVPFSNNQAERDIRCLKTKQKIASNSNINKSAKHYARIQSFTSTHQTFIEHIPAPN